MILVAFVNHFRLIGGNTHQDNDTDKKINSITLDYISKHNDMPNMVELRKIFNVYEKNKLKDIDYIISEASKYKEEDK